MAITFAVAGKGGVGKTTIAGLIVKYLIQYLPGSVLAIDADPSSNLNMVLGLDLDWTVGDIREDMLAQVKSSLVAGGAAMGALPGGVSKREFLDYQIRSSLSEGDRFDLIAMGRSEGPGCYCAVNHNLREVIDAISNQYSYIVIDNEAGLEHLSRRTTRSVEYLLIISDPTQRGLITATRIAEISKELDVEVEKAFLIVNKVKGELNESLTTTIHEANIPLLAVLPDFPQITEYDSLGQPLINLGSETPINQSVKTFMDKLIHPN
jgi:CO dehydrogenase maturation factor